MEITRIAPGPNPGTVTLAFVSSQNGLATVESTASMAGPWMPLGAAVQITGGVEESVVDTVAGTTARFYRVMLQ